MARAGALPVQWSILFAPSTMIEAGLLMMGFLLPLVNHAGTYESFELPKQLTLRFIMHVMLAGALACVLTGWRMDLDELRSRVLRTLRWPPVVVGLGVILAWCATTALSVGPAVSIWGTWPRWAGLWTQAHYVGLFLMAAAVLTTRSRLHRVAVVTSVAVTGSSIYAFVQNANPPLPGFRPHSTFGNPNFLADYISLSLPLALAAAVGARTPVARWLFACSAAVQLGAVWLTQTRGSWVALSLGVPLLALLLIRRRGGPWLRAIGALAVVAVLATGLLYAFRGSVRQIAPPLARVVSILEARDESALSRLAVWNTALQLWLDRPLLGFGPDTFGTVAPRRLPAQNSAILDQSTQELFDRAHNTTLDGLVAVGVLGMGALLVLAGLGFWCAVRLLLPAGREAEAAELLGDGNHLYGHPLAIGAACALVSYLVAQQFSIESAGASSLAWMVGGAVIGSGLRAVTHGADGVRAAEEAVSPAGGSVNSARSWAIIPAVALVAGVAVVSGWWEFREMQASIEFKRANGLARAERSAEAAAAYERSVELWPFERRYWLELGFARRHAARNLSEQAAKGWLTQSVSDVNRSIELDPTNPLYLSKWADVVGEVAQRLQDQALAQQALEGTQKALTIAPDRWLLWSDAGLTYLRLNKPVEARNALARALMLYDRDWVIFARYGDANAAVGDKQTARRAYQTALAMVGKHQGVEEALARLGPE